MFNLPFLHKNSPDSEKYVFMLYLSGEKAYGFAFNENNPEEQSALYQEHVDSFLKNTIPQVEKILANCESDLGENTYLKKTVLVLNSLYTTESGAVREDFKAQIKDLLRKVDLVNLGYLSFYESVAFNYKKLPNFYFLEESIYDYSLYSIEQGAVKKIEKIAKTQNEDSLGEIRSKVLPEVELVTYFYKKAHPDLAKAKHHVTEGEFRQFFRKIYFKDKESSPEIVADEKKQDYVEAPKSSSFAGLALAPGFTQAEAELAFTEDIPESGFVTLKEKFPLKFAWPNFVGKVKLPNLGWGLYLGLAFFGFVLLSIVYIVFFHRATISLATRKENYSTNTQLLVKSGASFVKEFSTPVALKTQGVTTGEKITGEKAVGEVTIYNGLFEKKDLNAGFRFKAGNGAIFVIDNDVSISSATKSASTNDGVLIETTAFGKKTVEVTAEAIGAEGNIDSGAKLTTTEIDSNNFYALANSDFNGGVKKTVAIFSEKDAQNLEKKVLAQARSSLVKSFAQRTGGKDFLFIETLSTDSVKKNYSEEVGSEANRVTLDYTGRVRALYSPYNDLRDKVQAEKLREKEFVDGTFAISNVKLKDSGKEGYTYSLLAKGQVQNFLDKTGLQSGLKGSTINSAKSKLAGEANINQYEIKTGPIPLPFLPFNQQRIQFIFNQ